jgi:hypothetical protein
MESSLLIPGLASRAIIIRPSRTIATTQLDRILLSFNFWFYNILIIYHYILYDINSILKSRLIGVLEDDGRMYKKRKGIALPPKGKTKILFICNLYRFYSCMALFLG